MGRRRLAPAAAAEADHRAAEEVKGGGSAPFPLAIVQHGCLNAKPRRDILRDLLGIVRPKISNVINPACPGTIDGQGKFATINGPPIKRPPPIRASHPDDGKQTRHGSTASRNKSRAKSP